MKVVENRRYGFALWLFSLVFVLSAVCSQAHSESLRSPWDTLPPGGRPAEQQCPVTPSLSEDLSVKGYYEDNTGSVVNKKRLQEYSKSTASIRGAAVKVVALADQYRSDGDNEVARCAARWLERLADDNALGGRMKGAQAQYVRAWMLNAFAVAWLKIRPGIGADSHSAEVVPAWLERLARATQDYHNKRNSRNNLRYWAGLAVMSAGIASNQRDLFDWGVDSFDVGASQIDKEGILPLELKRGSRSEHYHFFAAGPLVLMAELASSNGEDLYAVNDHALKRLVSLTVDIASGSRKLHGSASGKNPKLPWEPTHMVWLHSYAKRFPSPRYDELLKRFSETSSLYLGGRVP